MNVIVYHECILILKQYNSLTHSAMRMLQRYLCEIVLNFPLEVQGENSKFMVKKREFFFHSFTTTSFLTAMTMIMSCNSFINIKLRSHYPVRSYSPFHDRWCSLSQSGQCFQKETSKGQLQSRSWFWRNRIWTSHRHAFQPLWMLL